MSSASSDARPVEDGHEQPPVLQRERGPVRRRRLHRLRERLVDEPAPVDDIEEEPGAIQPSPTQRVAGFWTTMTANEMPVAIPPKMAKSGQSTAPTRRFGRAR